MAEPEEKTNSLRSMGRCKAGVRFPAEGSRGFLDTVFWFLAASARSGGWLVSADLQVFGANFQDPSMSGAPPPCIGSASQPPLILAQTRVSEIGVSSCNSRSGHSMCDSLPMPAPQFSKVPLRAVDRLAIAARDAGNEKRSDPEPSSLWFP